jgi:putative DNA primase/helicase
MGSAVSERISRQEVDALVARADLVALFVEDGSDVKRDGGRHVTCCPFHADGSPSCSIFEDGHFKCWGCGAYGDAIEYLRKRRKLSFDEALKALGAAPRLEQPRRIETRRKHLPIMPVPAHAPKTSWSMGKVGAVTGIWWFVNAAGERLMADVRYERDETIRVELPAGEDPAIGAPLWKMDKATWSSVKPEKATAPDASLFAVGPDGRQAKRHVKEVRTWCWARSLEDGSEGWACTRPADHLPLYGLDRLAARPDAPVVLVEGCKKSDRGQELSPGLVWLSWCGGSKATKRPLHDLAPLAGRRVILWPDFDKVGAAAMRNLAVHLRAAGVASLEVLDLKGLDHAQAWDVGDCTGSSEVESHLARATAEVDTAIAGMIESLPGELAEADAPPPGDRPPKPAPAAPDDRDNEGGEVLLATRFLADHGEDLRFCPQQDQWYVWDGKRWKRDEDGEITRRAEQTVKKIAGELTEESSGYLKEATACEKDNAPKAFALRKRAARLRSQADQVQTVKRIDSMVRLARSRTGIPVSPQQLDAIPYLLNCASGVIDLRGHKDGKVRVYQHNRKWLCTRMSPCDFDQDFTCSSLDRVLASVTASSAAIRTYLQDAYGSALIAGCRFELIHFLVGAAGSGKGTLKEAIKEALGDYCLTSDFQSFAKVQGQRIRSDLMRLSGARLVFASESDKTDVIDAQVLKMLSGGDTVTARQLYEADEEFRPTFSLFFDCNEEPRIPNDLDSGIWRRFRVVPTGPSVPEEDRDPDLKITLRDPARGGKAILAWLVAGAVRNHSAKHLDVPLEVRRATSKYRRESDPLREFLEQATLLPPIEKRDATWCKGSELTKAYAEWCDQQLLDRRFRLSGKGISKRLHILGCYIRKAKLDDSSWGDCWFGITLPTVDHLAKMSSYCPNEAEHLAALFRSFGHSATPENPPSCAHARTRAASKADESGEHLSGVPEWANDRKSDLKKEPEKKEKQSPPTDEPLDSIDLGSL